MDCIIHELSKAELNSQGVVCSHIETIKGGTSVSENPLHHQLKYSSCSLFSHGEWPLMYPFLLPPTNDFSLPQNLDFVE
jgi:hypothetical protein